MLRSLLLFALCSVPSLAVAQIAPSEFAARRDKLIASAGDGVIIVLGERQPVPDFLPYAQRSDFRYLTGFLEPDAALVMVQRGSARTALLFVQPRDPAQETWTGRRVGPDGTQSVLGIAGRSRRDLDHVVDSIVAQGGPLRVAIARSTVQGMRSLDEQWTESITSRYPAVNVSDASPLIAQLRAYKSDSEVALIRRAVDISVQAHLDALRAATPGMYEHEIQALVEYQFRRNGAERPAYGSIVGSGPNSTILHYKTNERQAQNGEMVVMDVGASYAGYAADITRSFPVNGRYSTEQRAIYEVVLAAQMAAERQIGPGRPARAMTDSSTAALGAGLARLGLIDSASATYECGTRQCAQLGLFNFHGLGHGLGLDVHDPDQYYFAGAMGVNSVYTIEPGVYVRENVLDLIPSTPANQALRTRLAPLVRRYVNVGVRVEDVFLVTPTGYEHLSGGIPRDPDGIERVMAEQYTGPSPRLSAPIRQ